jgi:hypothetical protein
MSLQDWSPDLQIAFRGVLDYLCHRLLTVALPEYHALEAVPDPCAAQIAQRMRDVIRKRIENGEWLKSEWIEQAHPQEIRNAIRNYIKESNCLNAIGTANDASAPHTSDNPLER